MYLFHLSRRLAWTCVGVTAALWLVAIQYGAFSRKSQRAYQDALADTNQVGFGRFLGCDFGAGPVFWTAGVLECGKTVLGFKI